MTERRKRDGRLRLRSGAPGEIRTPGLFLRREALYPAELRAHNASVHGVHGVIKVLSTATAKGGPSECSASAQYSGAVTPGIRGWITHIQAGKTAATPQITESSLKDSNYTTLEASDLETECQFLIRLGSGHGVCSCTAEDTAW